MTGKQHTGVYISFRGSTLNPWDMGHMGGGGKCKFNLNAFHTNRRHSSSRRDHPARRGLCKPCGLICRSFAAAANSYPQAVLYCLSPTLMAKVPSFHLLRSELNVFRCLYLKTLLLERLLETAQIVCVCVFTALLLPVLLLSLSLSRFARTVVRVRTMTNNLIYAVQVLLMTTSII